MFRAALSLLTALALCAAPAAGQRPLRIMPIGDSITEGKAGDHTYRFFLHHGLLHTGHWFDLVGERRGVLNGKPWRPDFDQDHEGHWGLRTEQVLVGLPFSVIKHKPDVALIHLGTNDLIFQQTVLSTVEELERMVGLLRFANPDVKVLVAQILPNRLVDVGPLNGQIARMARRLHTARSPVVAVDVGRGFDHRQHTYDGVHPNILGEQILAGWFLDALLALDLRCRASYRLRGQGCGPAPRPTLVQLAGHRPLTGSAFTVAFAGLPSDHGAVAGLLGFGELSRQGLPAALDSIGMPGCTLWAPLDVAMPLPTFSGFALWTLQIPPAPWIVGLEFHQQALIASPSSNAFGLVLSGGGSGIVGVR